MATYDLGKGRDDLTTAQPLPENWYKVRLDKDERKMNNAKTGDNLVLHMVVVSDLPEYDGRPLRVYLPFPNKGDEGEFTPIGQPKADAKIERIYDWAEAFEAIEGGKPCFAPGQTAGVYVTQDVDLNGIVRNSIAFVKPKRVEELEATQEVSASDVFGNG
jgi:hypothetical protein